MLKILIDLQSCQSPSKIRGIGRYSIDLVESLIENHISHGFDFHILINSDFVEESIYLRSVFEPIIGESNVHAFSCTLQQPVLHGKANVSAGAEAIRSEYVNRINPDFFFVTSFFEGVGDVSLTSIKGIKAKKGVIVYDLIPLLNQEQYLSNSYVKKWYLDKVDELKECADFVYAISEHTKNEFIQHTGFSADKVVTISSAVSGLFEEKAADAPLKKSKSKNDFILYTANLDPRKNLKGMLEAFSLVVNQIDYPLDLVIVSQVNEDGLQEIKDAAKSFGLQESQYHITGYISDEELIEYYNQCSLFVFPSLHEGFGLPCLEAMMCGAPVIGSNVTSIPEVVGLKEALFDPSSAENIAECTVRALTDHSFREKLLENSKIQAEKFSWDISSSILVNHIASLEYHHQSYNEQPLDDFVSAFKRKAKGYSDFDYRRAASDIGLLYQDRGFIYIDVTSISRFDAKTGIQRVVRSIVQNIPDEFYDSVKLVHLTDGGWYEYATEYQNKTMGTSNQSGMVTPVNGDKFIGLDLIADRAVVAERVFTEWRARGVNISIVVYDILPILQPHNFDQGMQRVFPAWLDMVARCADNIICISDSVAKDVEEYIAENATTISRCLPQTVSFFHLGADFDAIENVQQEEFQGMQLSKSFLMVGTIEPRKGHADVLSAFKLLQEESNDYNLIIVGKAGWNSDGLIRELEQLNKSSQNIHWLKDIDDNVLSLLYQNCCALISASHGEGFGLPLIEAAHHGLPIVARRLPVFLEVAGEGAYYFEESSSPKTIKDTIKNWIEMYERNEHPTSDRVSYLDWKQSSEKLFQNL